MNETRITHTASYLPARVVANAELAEMMETSDDWIYSRTGIKNRRVVENQNTSDLCTEVARALILKSGKKPSDIDFIIVATMTPDYSSPSTACLVQGNLEASNAMAFDISAACSGFVYALSMGETLIGSGKYQTGMVIAGETMSKVLDWEDRSTAVLFGDGAGGVLLENTGERPQFIDEYLQSDGSRGMSLTTSYSYNSSPFYQAEKKASTTLKMDGRSIFDFSLRNVSANIRTIVERNQLSDESIDYVLAHQANVRILDAVAKKSNLSRGKFLSNIASYANTSAASIPILLHECIEKGILQLGSQQKIVLTGFGGGLTWGSILLSL
ncbi:beta-ketoacyl-ACP synthase III [Vagococcus elongatus]|uniref:Beta-ketoacyl-[acyl-carrier-protein] synthase III n=1 Tax=Vagococcus elongatus TaxID=180344 RepID=A0A430ARS9_9ENTE|nr:beta-ketoacyl-ACP synthase III [Vagococcus elongatus]RSU10762.1 3-oxoacyl-ACP synthase [Vagococcus elongatus]